MTDLVPTADRPRIPAEYGIPIGTKGLLAWAHAEERLRSATVYWIATASRDGTPRVRPVDGLWHEGVLYVGGSPDTRWARDLAANPRISVHLDGGTDVVILEGEAELLENGAGPELARTLADLSNAKYPQYGMTPEMYTGPGPFAIRPSVAFGWTDFPKDVTRFRFAR
jgi:nitroimidazol reductase NimA-like FMN-containing flavoprotein (pyridoxamine 5'-phosphate oxidase superfamily)